METQETMFELTLKLSLPGNTLKKLKSYAMLSGMAVTELEQQLVSQVEPELSAHFDRVLTEGIVGKLSEMDGVRVTFSESEETTESVAEEEDPNEHQLSGDDLEEAVKSLDETFESRNAAQSSYKVPGTEDELRFDIRVPDAGGDAEQFLDTALSADAAKSSSSKGMDGPYGAMTGAAKRFQSGKPRVRISEHTGEESNYFDA